MIDSAVGFATPEDSLGFSLWQTITAWQRIIKSRLDPLGISHAQFVIMALLLWYNENQQAPIQSIIVERTKLDKMTVSQSLKKLAKEKLIRRTEDSYDTRAKKVSLTSKGKALTKKMVPLVEAVDKEFFAAISAKERNVLLACLHRLSADKFTKK